MRLIWQIFTKDARSLGWQALLPALLLGWLAQCDAGRTGATPGQLEGWLHLLVPLAWSFLVGAVVLEDAPIGDAPAWMTLPIEWHRLLAAKMVFLLLFVHLSLFISQAFILSTRGFTPWLHLSQLAAAQIGLLFMVTLPSLALASVVSNLAQYAACAFPLVALLAFLSGPWRFSSWGDRQRVEMGLCVSILGVASIFIVVCQYRRLAAPWWARAAGVCAVGLAATLYVWFPRPVAAWLKVALSPALAVESLLVEIAPAAGQRPPEYQLRPGRAVTLAIPVTTPGWPADNLATIGPVSLELETAQGEHIQGEWPSPNRPNQSIRLEGYLVTMPDPPKPASWQMLYLHPDLYRRLRSGPVKLRAHVLVEFLRPLPPVKLHSSVRTNVPGVGTCASDVLPGYGAHQMLRVACESPAWIPFGSQIRLVSQESNPSRPEYLGGATTYLPHPQFAWLSPLHRRDAFFHFPDSAILARHSGAIEVMPYAPRGAHVVSYELADLALDSYALSPLP